MKYTDEELSRLLDVMKVQSKSYNVTQMNNYIRDFLNKMGDVKWYFHKGSIYATRGNADSYPCVVAHTDTVHRIIPDEHYHVFHLADRIFAINSSTGNNTGVGGDDKVGIFVALEMLLRHPVMKCAFFKDEEVGCIGSRNSSKKFFTDVEFVLQCDRRNYKDFVRKIGGNELHDDAFAGAISDIMTEYGKVECLSGGSTDVGALYGRGVDVCMANISCGYYKPHTDEETIVVSEVMDTMNFVSDIITEIGGKVWKNSNFGKKIKHTHTSTWSGNRYTRNYGGTSDYYKDKEYCQVRREWVPKGDKIPCRWDPHTQQFKSLAFLNSRKWDAARRLWVLKDDVQLSVEDTEGESMFKSTPSDKVKCSVMGCKGQNLIHIGFTNSYYCTKCDRSFKALN